jgi:hypothetical protein
MRSEPSATAARVKLLRDGAQLEKIGDDRDVAGRTWRNVRDPSDGATGWIAAEFVASAVPPTTAPTASAPTAQAGAPPTQPAAAGPIVDIPAMHGKPAEDFDALFGEPIVVETMSPNKLESAPNGGVDRSYKSGKGMVQVILVDGRANGFFLTLEPKISGYDNALKAVNLPTGQRPTVTATAARNWDDLNGYVVRLTADVRTENVVQIVVFKRLPAAAASQPTAVPQSTAAPKPAAAATPTRAPATAAAPKPAVSGNCHPSYPDFCIPPPPPDVDCGSPVIAGRKNFRVTGPDVHRLDQGGRPGVACEG